jgi:hypothetical protein
MLIAANRIAAHKPRAAAGIPDEQNASSRDWLTSPA